MKNLHTIIQVMWVVGLIGHSVYRHKEEKKLQESMLSQETEYDRGGLTVFNYKEHLVEKTSPETTIAQIKQPVRKKSKITADDKAAFIKAYQYDVIQSAKELNMPPSVKMAQMMLESGYGSSDISQQCNNFFGIKHKNEPLTELEQMWITGKMNMDTHEEYNGKKVKIKDEFYVYKTPAESIRHHTFFLKKRIESKESYKHLAKLGNKDYKGWAKGLQESGYSTSSSYATKLITLIEENELYYLDN